MGRGNISAKGRGGRRVKTGCRTCKTRKVRCDETFPCCRRCDASGLKCEGYGIWGGGLAESGQLLSAPVRPLSILNVTPEEQELLDWFRSRAVRKLQASYTSQFWSLLLLQSSASEPAVLQSVVALGSVHRSGVTMRLKELAEPVYSNLVKEAQSGDTAGSSSLTALEEQMRAVTAAHYSRAINHLKPHFSAGSKSHVRVVLIVCIVFVTIDMLRSHFNTGRMHLAHGIKLLTENGSVKLNPGRDYLDEWIIDAFWRWHLQLELYDHIHGQSLTIPPREVAGSDDTIRRHFSNFKDIWKVVQSLLRRAMMLTQEATNSNKDDSNKDELVERQRRLLADIQLCKDLMLASKPQLERSYPTKEDREKCFLILTGFVMMATIMAGVSLGVGSSQMLYDQYDKEFSIIMDTMVELWGIRNTQSLPGPSRHLICDMRWSIMDMGCVIPVYYTAVKCRVHKIRLHAVKFMERLFHREGMWDSTLMARIARRVIEAEERRFFTLSPPHTPDDSDNSLEEASLPECHRFQHHAVQMIGEPVKEMAVYGCMSLGGDKKIFLGVYNVKRSAWAKIPVFPY